MNASRIAIVRDSDDFVVNVVVGPTPDDWEVDAGHRLVDVDAMPEVSPRGTLTVGLDYTPPVQSFE
jgi:hypothetical protein